MVLPDVTYKVNASSAGWKFDPTSHPWSEAAYQYKETQPYMNKTRSDLQQSWGEIVVELKLAAK